MQSIVYELYEGIKITIVREELGTSISNFPSMSVMVPCEVPFTITDAPITGSPSSLDKTVPVTRVCWATVTAMLIIKHKPTNSAFFMSFFAN
jgi:hypothetical protein